jgi:hypothetical protein
MVCYGLPFQLEYLADSVIRDLASKLVHGPVAEAAWPPTRL